MPCLPDDVRLTVCTDDSGVWGLPSVRAAIVLATIGGLALAGTGLSVAALTSGGHGRAGAVSRLAPAPSWNASASFGPIAVETAERGAGAGHGATHAEEADRTDELRVTVRLSNRLARPVVYSPGQFRLAAGSGYGTTSPVDPTSAPGEIGARRTVRQRLKFVVPVRRSSLALVFDDLGAPVDLGELASPPGTWR